MTSEKNRPVEHGYKGGDGYSDFSNLEDYDKSLEYRQLARWIILSGLILFIVAIFVYVLFFVD